MEWAPEKHLTKGKISPMGFVCIHACTCCMQCMQPVPFPVSSISGQGRTHARALSHRTSGSCKPELPFLIPHHHLPSWWALSALSLSYHLSQLVMLRVLVPLWPAKLPRGPGTHTKSLRDKSRMSQYPCPCFHSQLGHCHSRGPKV